MNASICLCPTLSQEVLLLGVSACLLFARLLPHWQGVTPCLMSEDGPKGTSSSVELQHSLRAEWHLDQGSLSVLTGCLWSLQVCLVEWTPFLQPR